MARIMTPIETVLEPQLEKWLEVPIFFFKNFREKFENLDIKYETDKITSLTTTKNYFWWISYSTFLHQKFKWESQILSSQNSNIQRSKILKTWNTVFWVLKKKIIKNIKMSNVAIMTITNFVNFIGYNGDVVLTF